MQENLIAEEITLKSNIKTRSQHCKSTDNKHVIQIQKSVEKINKKSTRTIENTNTNGKQQNQKRKTRKKSELQNSRRKIGTRSTSRTKSFEATTASDNDYTVSNTDHVLISQKEIQSQENLSNSNAVALQTRPEETPSFSHMAKAKSVENLKEGQDKSTPAKTSNYHSKVSITSSTTISKSKPILTDEIAESTPRNRKQQNKVRTPADIPKSHLALSYVEPSRTYGKNNSCIDLGKLEERLQNISTGNRSRQGKISKSVQVDTPKGNSSNKTLLGDNSKKHDVSVSVQTNSPQLAEKSQLSKRSNCVEKTTDNIPSNDLQSSFVFHQSKRLFSNKEQNNVNESDIENKMERLKNLVNNLSQKNTPVQSKITSLRPTGLSSRPFRSSCNRENKRRSLNRNSMRYSQPRYVFSTR